VSRENVELHHRAHDAFNRRDLDAFLALMDPDLEFTPYEVAVQGRDPYRGHNGVRSWWEETFEVLPDLRVKADEVRDLGERMTFARGRLRGQGAGSGASFERTLWQVVEWREKKLVWWRAFESEAEALEAAKRRA
jgi:ketosteroid isomerase-like protein